MSNLHDFNDPPVFPTLSAPADPRSASDSLAIHEHDLTADMTALPGQIAYWSAMFASATEAALEAKAMLEQQEADTSEAFRDQFSSGKEKLTEARLPSLVDRDPDVRAAKTRHIKAEANRLRVKGMLDALFAKRDMLVQVGARQRQEMGALEPTTRREPAPPPHYRGQ